MAKVRERPIESLWPSALAQQLSDECGMPAGNLAIPGWARGIERDLKMADGNRKEVEASWRLRLGLS